MELVTNPAVKAIFDKYPDHVSPEMLQLRNWVIKCAEELEEIKVLVETLKWGEPSYLVKKGTTLRMDWKEKNPNHIALFFQCTSMMLPTIKRVFGNSLTYEKNRAVIFNLNEELSEKEIKACIEMALTYHKYKHLPFLGR